MSLTLGMVGKTWIIGLLVVASAVGWALDAPEDAVRPDGLADGAEAPAHLARLARDGVDDARLGFSTGDADAALAAVRTLLSERAGVRGHDTGDAVRSLDAARLALDAVERTTTIETRAHELHIAAAQGQMARLGSDLPLRPQAPEHHDLVGALVALLEANGVGLNDIDPLALAELRTLDPALQGALGAVLVAFLGFQAADAAVEDQADLAHVIAARTDLILAAEQLAVVIDTVGAKGSRTPLQIAHVISIDLGPGGNTYDDDFLLLIDAGGDDTYRNNAGGNGIGDDRCSLLSGRTAAALVDLGGNDRYVGDLDCGTNGGGFNGAGLLYDNMGSDVYRAGSEATNGGALRQSTGMILDVRGDDVYEAGDHATNGGSDAQALGLIVDSDGDDTYTAGGRGTNGGGLIRGLGALIDGAGDDTYLALGRATNGGGADHGYGLLVDITGADRYAAGGDGANGGATDLGVGVLVDVEGADEYQAAQMGANGGGARGGIGLLFDYVGNDRFTAQRDGVNGGAFAGGFGALFDGAGHDTYLATLSGVNGGAKAGDVAGPDPDNEYCVAGSLCFTPLASWGLLVDFGGMDLFDEEEADASGTDRSVFPKGNVGAQLDFVPELDGPY